MARSKLSDGHAWRIIEIIYVRMSYNGLSQPFGYHHILTKTSVDEWGQGQSKLGHVGLVWCENARTASCSTWLGASCEKHLSKEERDFAVVATDTKESTQICSFEIRG